MAENSRFRQKLFLSLRVGVILNIAVALLYSVASVYQRSRVRSLEDSVIALSLRNADLTSRLALALHTLTNDYFRAAGAFVASYTSRVDRVSPPAPSILAGSAASSTNSPLPSLRFHTYFEVNNVPCCYLKRRVYRAGDLLLGYPITEISPEAVEYRGHFFPIEENQK